MKIVPQISALLLAFLITMTLCVPALATSTPTEDAEKVTVTSGATANVVVGVTDPAEGAANGGDTLLAYKVVEITYSQTSNTLEHEFTSLFTNFIGSGAGGQWSSLQPEDYGALEEDALKVLLGAFTAYVMRQNPVPGADKEAVADGDGVAIFQNMDMGQYIIVGSGSTQGAKIYQTVTAEVVPIVGAVEEKNVYQLYTSYTVSMKTSTPSVEKTISAGTVGDDKSPDEEDGGKHQQTASVGDVVTYLLTVQVPVYPHGATNRTFYLGDTLSEGLKLAADSFVVTGIDAGGNQVPLETPTAYATDTTGCAGNGGAFYVDFSFAAIAGYAQVTVAYQCTITQEAKVGTATGNGNDVDLVYSNDPFNGDTWTPETPEKPRPEGPGYGKDEDKKIVYTYALVVDKFEENQAGKKLAGAVFEVYKDADCKDPLRDADGKAVTLTTDDNGAAKLEGLAKGDWYLKEIAAPAGYNLLEKPVKITIDASNIPYTTQENQTVTHYTYTKNAAEAKPGHTGQAKINGVPVWMNDAGEVAAGDTAPEGYAAAYVQEVADTVASVILVNKGQPGSGYYKTDVANSSGMHLPSTGGMGTTLFYVVGGLLAVGAAVLLITKRRMNGSAD